MEYFNQSKENQRKTERLIVVFFSLYCINLCISTIRKEWDAWIPVFILATAGVAWIVFLSKYRNFGIRAGITTLLMQMTMILYAANITDLEMVIPTFMVLTVLVSFYGSTKNLWLTLISLAFIIFYHGIITDTFRRASGDTLVHLLSQLGNIICMEIIVYVWMRRRSQGNEEVHKIIDALMDAEQSKDDFLANVSHEIRTPVNTICGMSEMALREQNMDKLREEVFAIRDAGHNLMSLVSDILDFSQLQQGKMDLEEEAYNITSTINDIINTAMARKGDKQIELIVDCDADIPHTLLGDEKKIRRVIMNLVDNAIKYTNEGGILIGIHSRKENYGVNLCITVEDTGIGMSDASLEKLFDSFSQLDTRRNRQEGGVGLGLAISRALVMKMGGTITVRSHQDKGSTFRVVVPQKVLDERPIGKVEKREQVNIAAYFDMEQFDMLAIRDEYTSLIVHMVQQLKVKCHMCRNLAELKRREKQEPFTHVFISLEEYQEDEAYFDKLAEHAKIILVIERFNEKYISNRNLIRLYKPFYILPVISILNGSSDSEGGKQMVRPGKFVAPNAHILIVDDNRMNIRVVEGLLKEYQIKVTYATSGREALDVIENMCYDFVFMDHMMPEMDGVEAMHLIREKVGQYYKKVPIIALTANAAPGNREMFLEEGFDDFVAKPVEVSVLERVLKRNLPEEKLIFLNRENGDGQVMESVDFISGGEMKATGQQGEIQHAETGDGEPLVIGSLNVKNGLMYCGGREQYLEILEECCRQEKEYRQELQALYEKQDWKNYTIRVHGLKSTMGSIGADALSQEAKAMEAAGKNMDTEYILKHHEGLLAEYRSVIEELEQCSLLQPALPETAAAGGVEGGESWEELPELGEEEFDQFQKSLEEAVYSFDSAQMDDVLFRLQGYQYRGVALQEKLISVKKKIEMSDYMSAVDTLSAIREGLKKEKEGGEADA